MNSCLITTDKYLSKFIVLLIVLFFPLNAALSEYIKPAKIKQKIDRIDNNFELVPHGTYTYDISWQGLGVAEAKVRILPYPSKNLKLDNYKPNPNLLKGLTSSPNFTESKVKPDIIVHASAVTNGVVGFFYSLTHNSYSWINKKTGAPHNFASIQKENSKHKQETVGFGDQSIAYRRWKRGSVKDEDTFQYEGAMFDPISGFLNALAIKNPEIGKSYKYKIFTGKHMFLITFFVEKEEFIDYQGSQIKTLKIVPNVQKLTDTKGEDKLKGATLWITSGKNRRVIKVSSDVWLGSIDADLISFKPYIK